MYTPKLRPITTYEVNKPRQSHGESTSCLSLRRCLLIWAFLRLAVSLLWTGVVIIASWHIFKYYMTNGTYLRNEPFLTYFGLAAIPAQFVEIGMIVTFIVAGFKKSVELYCHYYRYCIFTLLVYIIAATLCLLLDYENGHLYGEIYLTYHFVDFGSIWEIPDEVVFIVAALLDVCLEILLIRFVKKLMLKYGSNANDGNFNSCETV